MLVYGDRTVRLPPEEALAELRRLAEAAAAGASGIARHAALVGLLVGTAQIVQARADARREARGLDDGSRDEERGLALLMRLAAAVACSWDGGFAAGAGVAATRGLKARLSSLAGGGPLEVRAFEGFAYYALYPEAYLSAARSLAGSAPVLVVGIRSIGTALGAVAAQALGTALPLTVRPVGDPFDRGLRIGPDHRAAIRGHAARGGRFAIADEGPGLSGSSMASVAALLEAEGAAAGRITLVPGHGGEPGAQASAAVRSIWSRLHRAPAASEALLAGEGGRLRGWVEQLLGERVLAFEDISGGLWRRRRRGGEALPAQRRGERRKFLAATAEGRWLVKFAGLESLGGTAGSAKLALARALRRDGFVAEPAGLAHGFLVERWIDDAEPDLRHVDRQRLVERLGDYVGARAARPCGAQASREPLAGLLAMAERNVALAFHADAGRAVRERWARDVAALESCVRPAAVDGRMHRWEWLAAGGRLIKTDALDHHCSHDVVGAQDIGWDVAGAEIEFGLSPQEADRLGRIAGERRGEPVDPALLRFYRLCYPAFQLGAFTLSAGAEEEPQERRLLAAEIARYRRAVGRRL